MANINNIKSNLVGLARKYPDKNTRPVRVQNYIDRMFSYLKKQGANIIGGINDSLSFPARATVNAIGNIAGAQGNTKLQNAMNNVANNIGNVGQDRNSPTYIASKTVADLAQMAGGLAMLKGANIAKAGTIGYNGVRSGYGMPGRVVSSFDNSLLGGGQYGLGAASITNNRPEQTNVNKQAGVENNEYL